MTARSAARPRLRTRLIAWYAGTLCCVLLLTAAALRFGVERTLDRAHVESLESSVALFRQFFRVEIAEYRSVEATVSHIAASWCSRIGSSMCTGLMVAVQRDGRARDRSTIRRCARRCARTAPARSAARAGLDDRGARQQGGARRRLASPRCVAVGWDPGGRAARGRARLVAGGARLASHRRIGRAGAALDAVAGARCNSPIPPTNSGSSARASTRCSIGSMTALAQQRRFLADAAHELRTPIARLRSRVEMGRVSGSRTPMRPRCEAEADRMLATLDGELRDTSEVLHGLLALARADADTEPSRFSVGYLDDALSPMNCRAGARPPSAAGVQVILGHLRRSAGAIRCGTDAPIAGAAARQRDSVHTSGHRDHGAVSGVHDASQRAPDRGGSGDRHRADDREAVFERFHRTEEARAHRADGSGLGLALARWIVLRHGGTIRAASRADGGAGVALIVAMPIGVPAGELLVERGEPVGSLPGPA
jgi:two-component system, OmpR family, sensor kinase